MLLNHHNTEGVDYHKRQIALLFARPRFQNKDTQREVKFIATFLAKALSSKKAGGVHSLVLTHKSYSYLLTCEYVHV